MIDWYLQCYRWLSRPIFLGRAKRTSFILCWRIHIVTSLLWFFLTSLVDHSLLSNIHIFFFHRIVDTFTLVILGLKNLRWFPFLKDDILYIYIYFPSPDNFSISPYLWSSAVSIYFQVFSFFSFFFFLICHFWKILDYSFASIFSFHSPSFLIFPLSRIPIKHISFI